MDAAAAIAALGRPIKWDRAVFREAALLARNEIEGGRELEKCLSRLEAELDQLLGQWLEASNDKAEAVGECVSIYYLSAAMLRFVFLADVLLDISPDEFVAAAENLIESSKSAATATGDYSWAADVLAVMIAETRYRVRESGDPPPAT